MAGGLILAAGLISVRWGHHRKAHLMPIMVGHAGHLVMMILDAP